MGIDLEDQDNQQDDRQHRNINPEQHAKNPLYQKMCLYCGKNEKFLVSHYVKEHNELEVPIARPSVEMATQIRNHADNFELKQQKIAAMCYFCEETKQMAKHNWVDHYLKHTGESKYTCSACSKRFDRKLTKHANCTGEVTSVIDSNSSNGTLIAFMCTDCNYMQFHLSSIEKHLLNEHKCRLIAEGRQYEKVMLMPDLTPIASDSFTKYEYAALKIRYRCNICTEMLSTDNEFNLHFDEKHKLAKKYDCFCGEEVIENNSGHLTGQMVADHLLRHADQFFECVNCERIFGSRGEINHHMMIAHRDSPKLMYRHFCRAHHLQAWVSENVMQQFKCKVCKKVFDGTYGHIVDHFAEKHRLARANANIIVSRKVTFLADQRNTAVTKSIGYTYSRFKINLN